MALNVIERLWERKSFTYPEGAHIPDMNKNSSIVLKPRTTAQKAAMRRLSNSTETQACVERVLRKYSMSMSNQQGVVEDEAESDDDEEEEEEHEDEFEIESSQNIIINKRDSVQMKRRVSLAPDTQASTSSTARKRTVSMVNTKLGEGTSHTSVAHFKHGRQSVSFAIPESESDKSTASSDDPEIGFYFQGNRYPIMIRNEFHKIIYNLVGSKFFSGFILMIILLNTLILIASTSHIINARVGWYFTAIDHVFLGIYLMEIILKLYALRKDFFTEGWNILDLVIVIFNMIDFMIPLIVENMNGLTSGAAIFRVLRIFRAVRAIRALRVLRTIRFLSNLQVIMTTVLQSIKSIGAIVMLISLFMYMFAVVGRGIYSKADPEHFGNLFSALFTLFQLLTLDDWFEIYETITKHDPSCWHVVIYLLLYILVEYFVFLNLFVAVLVDNFQLALEARNANPRESEINVNEDEPSKENEPDKGNISDDSDEEESDERKDIKDYTNVQLTEQERADLRRYLELLASQEYNTYSLQQQHRILNLMVNLCVDTSDNLN